MVYGTYVASPSIMFERSCLLPNIEALIVDKFTCTFLWLQKKMHSNHAPSYARFFLQNYMQEGAWSMHICKFFCFILVDSNMF